MSEEPGTHGGMGGEDSSEVARLPRKTGAPAKPPHA